MKEWLLTPLDTLFFRNGLSMDAGESGWVESIFPPSPQTMQGVVRSSVILSHCKAPKDFQEGKCKECTHKGDCRIPDFIGSSENKGNYGKLNLCGPCIVKDGINYYPAPLDLVREKEGEKRLFTLSPSDEYVECELGKIRLPSPNNDDYKPFDVVGGWISEEALKQYLEGKIPDEKGIIDETVLFTKEPRVGLKRVYETHKAEEGMLYSIVPLRFKKDVKMSLLVCGIPDDLEPKGCAVKVGGEGRVCELDIGDEIKEKKTLSAKLTSDDKRIKIVFLQPGDFGGKWYPSKIFDAKWCPLEFKGDEKMPQKFSINGVELRLVSACVGRSYKLGGWDMGKRAVKPMRSLVPHGSTYYFEVLDGGDPTKLNAEFTENKTGLKRDIGFGQYVIGRW